jgi:hypothetical protein
MLIYYLQLERRGAAAFLDGLAAVFLVVVAFFAGADAFLNRACTFILSNISTATRGELKKLCDLWLMLIVERD